MCTQPRRVAAKGVAERVSKEYNGGDATAPLGGLVGYHMGKPRGAAAAGRAAKGTGGQAGSASHRRVSDSTRIVFVTEGVMLLRMRSDPLLEAYDVIVVHQHA